MDYSLEEKWIFIVGKSNSTNDRDELIRMNKKLNAFIKFVHYFLLVTTIGSFFALVSFPIVNEKHLILNIAFPLDRNNSSIAFWLALIFIGGGFFCCILCVIFTMMTWYLMFCISCEYKLLGNQLRHMGTTIGTGSSHLKVSLAAQQQLFLKDFIIAIQACDKING